MSKSIDTKDKILESAKNIAFDKGLNQVDIRSVAKKAKISIGTVYNYYPSKAELLVAVIEDFWKGAFIGIEKINEEETDLFNNLRYIYYHLLKYLDKFKENWLNQLSLLQSSEKEMGKKREEKYFKIVEDRIVSFIDKDKRLDNYNWTDDFTKEMMAEFIFDNIFILLNNGREDIDFFLKVLEKTLF